MARAGGGTVAGPEPAGGDHGGEAAGRPDLDAVRGAERAPAGVDEDPADEPRQVRNRPQPPHHIVMYPRKMPTYHAYRSGAALRQRPHQSEGKVG